MEQKTWQSTPADEGVRLDVYVARMLSVSRTYAQDLIKKGLVRVQDNMGKANCRLEDGQDRKSVV